MPTFGLAQLGQGLEHDAMGTALGRAPVDVIAHRQSVVQNFLKLAALCQLTAGLKRNADLGGQLFKLRRKLAPGQGQPVGVCYLSIKAQSYLVDSQQQVQAGLEVRHLHQLHQKLVNIAELTLVALAAIRMRLSKLRPTSMIQQQLVTYWIALVGLVLLGYGRQLAQSNHILHRQSPFIGWEHAQALVQLPQGCLEPAHKDTQVLPSLGVQQGLGLLRLLLLDHLLLLGSKELFQLVGVEFSIALHAPP